MNIGRLDKLITIEQPTNVTSAMTGERTKSWATLAQVWATITYPRSATASKEGVEAGVTTATNDVEFTIRYRSDVSEAMRVSYNSQTYEIRRVNYVGQRNEMLKLITEVKY